MKRGLEGLHAPSTPQEIRRIRFVSAKRPDAVAVPEGLDILVLNAELKVRFVRPIPTTCSGHLPLSTRK